MSHQTSVGGQLSENREEDDLRGEEQAESREEAPPARESRQPDGQEQAGLVGGQQGERALGVPGCGQLRQGLRGQGDERAGSAEHRRGERVAKNRGQDRGSAQGQGRAPGGPRPSPGCRRWR